MASCALMSASLIAANTSRRIPAQSAIDCRDRPVYFPEPSNRIERTCLREMRLLEHVDEIVDEDVESRLASRSTFAASVSSK